MKSIFSKFAVASAAWMIASFANAEIAVIVNLANQSNITTEDVQKIYLAKTKTFPGGGKIVALDQTEGAAPRMEFVSKIIKKDEAQMKAYWSRLIFTGKGVPPKVMASDAEVVEAVASNTSAIGFVDVGAVTDKVRVVGKF
ncbi:Conserved hypothetical protein [gamma proteobacterium HdN1]|nr:Conserved hypothetical protein [gamma proteobacterium HdN1]